MFAGLALVAGVGLVWVLVGVVLARVAAARIPVFVFYAAGGWLAAAFAWGCLTDWNVLRQGWPARAAELAGWIGAAGVVNAAGQILLVKAMSIGHKGVSWAMAQMAMLLPFLAPLVFWREPLRLPGLVGVLLLLSAVVLLGWDRAGREGGAGRATGRWLLLVLGALLLIGASQALQTVPSHWSGWTDAGRLRAAILLTAGAMTNTFWILLWRLPVTLPAIRYGVCWAALAILSYLLLFRGLDYLAAAKISCFAFPVAQATCMLGFALYSGLVLRERFRLPVRVGLACALLGIFLMIPFPSG